MKMNTEDLFREIKKIMFAALGKDALDERVIDLFCKKIFGRNWQPTSISSEYKYVPNKYTIINSCWKPTSGGKHWIAIRTDNDSNLFIYDSFGRDLRQIVSHLMKNIPKNVNILETEPDAEQRGTTQVCGQLCISWLILSKILGEEAALDI